MWRSSRKNITISFLLLLLRPEFSEAVTSLMKTIFSNKLLPTLTKSTWQISFAGWWRMLLYVYFFISILFVLFIGAFYSFFFYRQQYIIMESGLWQVCVDLVLQFGFHNFALTSSANFKETSNTKHVLPDWLHLELVRICVIWFSAQLSFNTFLKQYNFLNIPIILYGCVCVCDCKRGVLLQYCAKTLDHQSYCYFSEQ